MSLTSNSGMPGSPSLPSAGIQSLLEKSTSDALLLYDSCLAADTTMTMESASQSVTELIAACGATEVAPGVGEHSFTNALIQELILAPYEPISVSQLRNRIFARLNYHHERELRKTPVHTTLTFDYDRKNIMLAPLRGLPYPESVNGYPVAIHGPCDNRVQVIFDVSPAGPDFDRWQEWILRAPADATRVVFFQLVRWGR